MNKSNIKAKMNSECKVSTTCRKSNSDTNVPTTLVCSSMIILHIFSVFIRDYYQPLMSNTKSCQLLVYGA